MIITLAFYLSCDTETSKVGLSLKAMSKKHKRHIFHVFPSEYVTLISEAFHLRVFHLCFIFKRYVAKSLRCTFKVKKNEGTRNNVEHFRFIGSILCLLKYIFGIFRHNPKTAQMQ